MFGTNPPDIMWDNSLGSIGVGNDQVTHRDTACPGSRGGWRTNTSLLKVTTAPPGRISLLTSSFIITYRGRNLIPQTLTSSQHLAPKRVENIGPA